MVQRDDAAFVGTTSIDRPCDADSSQPMFWNRFVRIATLGWAIFVSTMAVQAEKPKNVVLIVGDDMGWTDYGFMGHEAIKTPNLDRLASEGALFPSGYTPTSLCRASLATLLTGLYASQHKICCNDPPQGVDRSEMLPFLRDAPTIPRLLKDRGYRSFQSGKFWEGHYSNGGFTQGLTTKGRHGDDGLVIGRKTMKPIYDFISSCGDSPFFVWYAPMMPHEPHDPPERILKKYEVAGREPKIAKYWAMCEWFDETCGELVQWIDDHGLREDTLIVYVVDNGWLQTNGPVRNGEQFLTRSKNTPYEDGVRTPVILRCPGWIAASRKTELVSTIDLAPTILAACGAAAPQVLPGLNLLPVVREGKTLERHDVFGEIYFHDCVELGKPRLSVTHRWIRHNDWKLIVPMKSGSSPELYQVKLDPHERLNRAASDAAQVAELSRLLDQRWNPQAGTSPDTP
ncbi:sulfatase family protein [Schlesneria paludicola]|uniref:sulfatase family protein n=1 Tax=Schlesneria paludicola TaxID=360056 RepID=UPI00192B9D30|nr:sulfatase-like hydrolase/transferase [Schlesneria paludicola]